MYAGVPDRKIALLFEPIFIFRNRIYLRHTAEYLMPLSIEVLLRQKVINHPSNLNGTVVEEQFKRFFTIDVEVSIDTP